LSRFRLSKQAFADVQGIWEYLFHDSPEAADRILDEFFETFGTLAQSPGAGHVRRDLTNRDVLFWPVRSYLVVYAAKVRPLSIVRVLHGKRDLKKLLRSRLPNRVK
jgi:plasmid stabilization system protein ParE